MSDYPVIITAFAPHTPEYDELRDKLWRCFAAFNENCGVGSDVHSVYLPDEDMSGMSVKAALEQVGFWSSDLTLAIVADEPTARTTTLVYRPNYYDQPDASVDDDDACKQFDAQVRAEKRCITVRADPETAYCHLVNLSIANVSINEITESANEDGLLPYWGRRR